MKLSARWIVVGSIVFIISYAGFLIGGLPAQWVTERLNSKLSDGHLPVKLVQARGSIWNGRALVLDQARRIGYLNWSLEPVALLGGQLQSRVRLTGSQLRLTGQLAMGSSATVLKAVNGRTSVSWLARAVQLPDTLRGQVRLHFKRVRLNADRHLVYANGQIQILKARLPTIHLQLGTLRLQLSTHRHQIEGHLSSAGGALRLLGTIQLYGTSRYLLHLRMKPTSRKAKDRLENGLSGLLGLPDPSGWYHYNASGKL